MTEQLKKIYVDCYRDDSVIASYPFAYSQLPVPFLLPSDQDLIDQAKVNLSNERHAAPPYAEIRFVVRR